MAVFELCDGVAGGPDVDPLGLWASPPPERAAPALEANVDFGAPAPKTARAIQPAAPPRWRATYHDPAHAAAHLNDARRQLQTAQSTLTLTPYRLDGFVAQRRAGMALSFPAPGAEPAQPEDELALLLPELQAGGPVVFSGPLDQLADAQQAARGIQQDARQAFEAFARRLQQMVSHMAFVETLVAGELVGRTRVSWAGDVQTDLRARVPLEQMHLHRHTVDTVLESRRALLRTSTTIIAGAVKLSVLLASPAGFVAAFPAILRFINRLRKQLENN